MSLWPTSSMALGCWGRWLEPSRLPLPQASEWMASPSRSGSAAQLCCVGLSWAWAGGDTAVWERMEAEGTEEDLSSAAMCQLLP